MRLRKRIAAALTSTVCGISVCFIGVTSLTASAEDSDDEDTSYSVLVQDAVYGDMNYSILDYDGDGVGDCVEITDCDEAATEVEIPDEIEGLPVTSIGDSAFKWCTELVNATLPDSITSIDNMAFCCCYSLTDITIPDSVTSIGISAFWLCKTFTNIVIPNSVTSIGNQAFCDCDNLESIVISENITTIGTHAFSKCESLKSVTLPASVTSIGRYAFYQCTGLTSITLSENVTIIDAHAFQECFGLTSIIIPESVESIGQSAFLRCNSLSSITIENPNCKIYSECDTICNAVYDETGILYYTGIIYGYENSTAQAYAEQYNGNFVSLGEYRIKGDISGNGSIDLYDAIEIAKSLMGMRTFTEEEQKIADYNGDGTVDLYDAIAIAKYLLENT